MKDDIRRLLDSCPPPPPDPAAKDALLSAWRALPRRGLSPAAFVWAQLGFIRVRMWAAQGLLLAFLTLLIRSAANAELVYLLLGAALPLLIIINIADLMRIYNGRMLELELATRYSLPRVCAARLLIFGVTDSAVVLCAAALGAAATRTHLLTLLLYCLTPFTLMCAACLTAMRFLQPDQLLLSAVFLVLTGGAALAFWKHPLYLPQNRRYWLAALLLALALLAAQNHALSKKGVFSCKL